jgi:hypothetical protein
LFDSVAIVDWSARATPSPARPSKDAIWIGVCGEKWQLSTYHRTRAAAEAAVVLLLEEGRRAGRRMLLGFDFPMGYPVGFARRVTGADDPRGLWAWLAQHVTDDAGNASNRLAVGGAMNALFAPNRGPFWGRPKGQVIDHLPFKKEVDYAAMGLSEQRKVEHLAKGAKSVFQLMGAGSVGSQALTGLPMIHRVAQLPGVAVWPFDADLSAPVVLAEVYPSLMSAAVAQDPASIKDEAQVRLLSRALWNLAQAGQLAQLFGVPEVAREEGWILGAGHGPLLEQALTWS